MTLISVKIPALFPGMAIVILSAAALVRPALADYISSELGAASGWAVLDIGSNGNVNISGPAPPGSIGGNVGVIGTSPGNFSDSGVPISGSLYLGGSQSATLSGATVTGGILNNQSSLLSQAASAAVSASTAFAGLTATQSVSGNAIAGSTTINGTAGVNVVDLTGISLSNGQVLTLNGPAGSEFIINDTGGISLNSATIALTGGLTANDVVFDVTGGNVQTSGGLGNESVLAGTILAPNENVQLAPGAFTGEIISGQNISIASGGSVTAVHGAPGPKIGGGLPGFVLLGGGLLLARRLRRKWEGVRPALPAGV